MKKETLQNKKTLFAIYNSDVNSDMIELNKLEDITDEDVFKVAELLLWRRNILKETIISQTKELILNPSKVFTLRQEDWADVIDKIRELGYAYRWNSISVKEQVEYGWIKLKQNEKRTNNEYLCY
jgi:hypothetical protein